MVISKIKEIFQWHPHIKVEEKDDYKEYKPDFVLFLGSTVNTVGGSGLL